MQVRALIISLFLAASVAAAPARSKGHKSHENPSESVDNNIGKDMQNNPAIDNDNANHDGNGNGDGNGSTIDSNNGGNGILNDSLNFNYGADSRQISEEVVAAMKSLTLTCHSSSEGVMSCKWKS
ncbi:hypothetical protein GGS24DRAFT_458741 [Hypoxylon argillaceum]|nr:hypothetical protein GGS24DRAFT_458741 [Hypoxylon argillaceum]